MVVLKNAGFSFCFLGFQLFSVAQYKVTFVVSGQAAEKVYVVGNFNGWNPRNEKFALTPFGNQQRISLDLAKGRYEFKFTRGGWDKVECLDGGAVMQNRTITIDSDTTINFTIQEWADHFPAKKRVSTASRNVHIVDTAFYIPQLNRKRRIWIYLPASYVTSTKNYPVLYMHDGQNVFDDATSGFGEWGVDEALDSLGSKNQEIIVVAIDHGSEKRMNEYSPFDMQRFGKGEGDLYVDFLAKTLKPYIDKHYRTKKDEKNCFVAGSSMGGLISFYAILKYPKIFGGAGVFSPSFWIAPQLRNINSKQAKKVKGKIYFFASRNESESMVPDMLNVFEQMRKFSKAKMKTVIKAEGKHNEATWREAFPEFYNYLTSSSSLAE